MFYHTVCVLLYFIHFDFCVFIRQIDFVKQRWKYKQEGVVLIETKMCSWLFQDGCKPDKSPSVMNNFGLPVQNARHSKCPAAVHCFPPFALRHFRSFTRREVTRHSSQGLVCPCRLLRANEEGGRAGSGFLRPPSSQTSLRVRELHLRWFSNRTEILRDTLPFHFFWVKF